MCDTCGCEENGDIRITKPGEDQVQPIHHKHDENHKEHDHPHDHTHQHVSRKIILDQNILLKNDLLAERNRGFFEAKKIMVFNMVSSPGSGKTSLLEKTILKLKDELEMAVIEGDQQTANDAMRIDKAGANVVQINTGNGCHLDSNMIHMALKKLNPKEDSMLFIENVGNLVCPSLFDLGENKRVVIISVTEGDDKPLKYPNMFQSSHLCIINKIDLCPYVDFNMAQVKQHALQVNPLMEFIELSVKTGDGINNWFNWIRKERKS
ncbi:MAG: hydrogenase nickel incorporation protein HypB [Bacteroidetes bacterium]|nr:hydrogenase nickel incorporation protein HypB [Bacteroidota bacterium]MBL6962959.1 hydrogenase nickel incorporation protein HypB [Bacteroidota bacterium]